MTQPNITAELVEALEQARGSIEGLGVLLVALSGASKSLAAETAIERIDAALTKYREASVAPPLDEQGARELELAAQRFEAICEAIDDCDEALVFAIARAGAAALRAIQKASGGER